MRSTVKSKLVAYIVALILVVFCLFPVYWMLITSLKNYTEIYQIIPTFWPEEITFEGYYELFVEKGFLANVINSLIVSLVVSGLSILVSLPAAYAIARIKFRGRKNISK